MTENNAKCLKTSPIVNIKSAVPKIRLVFLSAIECKKIY
jgi:hypothetical protein